MHPQPVETGESYGDDTVVPDGLKPGMRIAAIRKRHAGIKVVAAAPAKGDAPGPDQASR